MNKPTRAGKIQAKPTPQDKNTMQITYETESGRTVINLPSQPNEASNLNGEPEPHGAGSFHDPEHHQQLMDRVDEMLKSD